MFILYNLSPRVFFRTRCYSDVCCFPQVKEGTESMLHQFEHEQTSIFFERFEGLVAGVGNLLPKGSRSFFFVAITLTSKSHQLEEEIWIRSIVPKVPELMWLFLKLKWLQVTLVEANPLLLWSGQMEHDVRFLQVKPPILKVCQKNQFSVH